MDKSKLILPITILLGCIILGGFYYASQLSKQRSIEKQQQIDLQAKAKADQVKMEADEIKADLDKATLQTKLEQEKKEYIAKRKKDCYEIYEKEGEKYNNVESFDYVETCGSIDTLLCKDDSCRIVYKNGEWKENDPNSCDWTDNLIADEKTCTIERYFRKYF